MSAWRRQIIDRLPELRAVAEAAENPMALWIELLQPCEEACRRGDADFVGRVHAAARWFLESPSDELRTAVACAFYEHLPRSEALWADLPRRMNQSEFTALMPCWEYHGSPEQIGAQARRLAGVRAGISRSLP